MTARTTCAALALLIGATAMATSASADTMTMWVRASGTNAASKLVDLWNATHADKIELTTIPDNQMVTKLATGVQAGEVPDLVSFDLIYMPDFMKAGFLVDLTSDLKADPNYASVAQAYKDIATYEGKLYGAGFTPDVSILVWNKDLFKKAGLDPDKPPRTIGEIHEDAKKIRALGPDTYGFYFSGVVPRLQHLHHLADDGGGGLEDPARQRQGRRADRRRRQASARSVQGDVERGARCRRAPRPTAARISSPIFKTGKIGIQGAGGFLISDLKHDAPEPEFRRHLPARREGRRSLVVRRRRRRRNSRGLQARRRSPRPSSPGN